MSRNIDPADKIAVDNALSFLVGKTIAVLADESKVAERIVRRLINDGLERGLLERKGNRYRIENAAPWRDR